MKYYFLETFDSDSEFENRWVYSTSSNSDDANLTYDGKWKIVELESGHNVTNKGLQMNDSAKHYAISTRLEQDIEFDRPTLIIQYHVKFPPKKGCGGGYIKLLSARESNADLSQFNDKSPFTIMFGPDRCEHEQKFHFILRYEDAAGKWEEKHINPIPTERYRKIFIDNSFHLLKLVLNDNNTFEIFLDYRSISSGSLFNSFTPSINPPEYVEDPEDIKPRNWDDKPMIPDPSSSKPSDWDTKYPSDIKDPKAKKPQDWQEDIEPYISSSSTKPTDWDETTDGEWMPEQRPNPNCVDGKCGKWSPPMIPNPNFKEWQPKLIKNSNYQGVYKPRTIKNPNYHFNTNPYKMTPITAIGIELWSVEGGIMFDNILITDEIKASLLFDSKTFKLTKMQIIMNYFMNAFMSSYFIPTCMALFFGGVILFIIYYSFKTPTTVTEETDPEVPATDDTTKIAESDEDPMSNVKKRSLNNIVKETN